MVTAASRGTGRAVGWNTAAAAGLVGLGIALAADHVLTLAMCGLALFAVLTLLARPGVLVVVLLGGTMVTPSLVLLATTYGVGGAVSSLAGQARWVIFVLALVLLRALIRTESIVVPRPVKLAIALAVALYVGEVVVGAARHTLPPGWPSLLQRQLSYPLAALIAAWVASARGFADRAATARVVLTTARIAAVAAIAAGIGAAWYSAWLRGHVAAGGPVAERLFDQVRTASLFPRRSTFPFVQDSPNVGILAVLALAAFAVPVLLDGGRADRLLAATAVLAAGAGVFAAESRTGVIGLAAAACAWLIFSWRDRRRRTSLIILTLLAAVAVQAYAFLPAERKFAANAPTLVARQSIWRQAVADFREEPAFGHGYHYSAEGNFIELAALGAAPVTHGQSVQSEYLGQLVDGGVAGGMLFLLMAFQWLRVARGGLRTELSRGAGIGFSCALAAVCAAMAGSAVLQSAAVSTVVWFLFGLTAVAASVRIEAGVET